MNKTIIINISGVIFHIEEDAYQLLKSYMDDIKRHFGSYKDNFEIVSDIESRIAEMLSELLLTENKQVIVVADVNNVTQRMGKPADFETGEEEDYDLSGNNETPLPRKLFRDTEDRFIGGVCAGIAHYFDIDAKWVRIAFILMFIFYGFGLLTYALLWIVMPKAKTRTEKMEMKGEKINLQAFQKNIEEELNAVKSNLKNVRENVPALHKLGSFIRDVFEGLFNFLGNSGKMVFKFIGICLMVFIGILLTVAFVFLMVFLGYAGNTDIATIFPLNIINEPLRPILFICSFLVIVVPLLALLFLLLRLVFNSKTISRSVSFGLATLWILAVAVGVFCIAKNATEFKEEASYNESLTLKANSANTYILKLGDERTVQENISGDGLGAKVITIAGSDRDFDTPNNLDFELKISEGDFPILSKTYAARGSNFNQALKNAHQIDYYYHQKDSILTFDYRFGLKGASLWRSQKVDIKLQIPINSTLLIEKRMANRLFRYELDNCIDEEASDDSLIPVKVTKNGFSCNKTLEAIEKQKKYNTEHEIEEEVSDTVLF
jgi:phage shock protein PspC (stress-responsive transcriptional regulator)